LPEVLSFPSHSRVRGSLFKPGGFRDQTRLRFSRQSHPWVLCRLLFRIDRHGVESRRPPKILAEVWGPSLRFDPESQRLPGNWTVTLCQEDSRTMDDFGRGSIANTLSVSMRFATSQRGSVRPDDADSPPLRDFTPQRSFGLIWGHVACQSPGEIRRKKGV